MCNYKIDFDLLTNGVQLKACDFEQNETTEIVRKKRKTQHPSDREERRIALKKAKQRKIYALKAKMK